MKFRLINYDLLNLNFSSPLNLIKKFLKGSGMMFGCWRIFRNWFGLKICENGEKRRYRVVKRTYRVMVAQTVKWLLFGHPKYWPRWFGSFGVASVLTKMLNSSRNAFYANLRKIIFVKVSLYFLYSLICYMITNDMFGWNMNECKVYDAVLFIRNIKNLKLRFCPYPASAARSLSKWYQSESDPAS